MERDKSNGIDINGFSRSHLLPWKILLVTSLDSIILRVYKFSFQKQITLFKIHISWILREKKNNLIVRIIYDNTIETLY